MTQDWKAALAALSNEGNIPQAADSPEEPAAHNSPSKKDTLTIFFERKGRHGKSVTIIEGFTLSDEELAAIATTLKQKIGTGGSARNGEILLQGDRRQQAAAILKTKGFKIKNL